MKLIYKNETSIPFISLVFLLNCNSEKKNELISESESTSKKGETMAITVPKKFLKLEPSRYNVGFPIMEGTYNTELTAPYDIFQHTVFKDGIKAMSVFTVANTDYPISTFEGMRILPDFNYVTDTLPKIDILVIPSAEHHLDSDLEDEAMLNFVKRIDKET